MCRVCSRCKEEKEHFYGNHAWCADCIKSKKKMYWLSLSPDEKRVTKYVGFTVDQLKQMEIDQAGQCKICYRKETLVIDHCHQTGVVRGLLCNRCNTGLGKFADDVALLERAKEYLTGV